jgi:two-component system sensor histidine kinase AlgZ
MAGERPLVGRAPPFVGWLGAPATKAYARLMAKAPRACRPAPDREPLVPSEIVWFYPVAPICAFLLLCKGGLHMPSAWALRHLLSMSIHCIVLTAAFHALYVLVMPRWVAAIPSPLGRAALHVAVTILVAVPLSLLIHPLKALVVVADGDARVPRLDAAIITVLLTWMLLFPALAVQAARNRAYRVEKRAHAERQAMLQAQLSALQARTNPHFFFNSVNTVASLIPEDPELAERTLERLADLFRYALDSSRTRSVPLEREIEMVRDYLAIQAVRFGSRLVSRVTVDPALARVQVAPLILQPLVENALLHGLGERRSGTVEVSALHQGDAVVIEVRDDGPGPGGSAHRGTQTSVHDLAERVRLTYGDGGGLTLESAPGGGCVARLKLPLGGIGG